MIKDYNLLFDKDPDIDSFFNKPGYGPVLVDGIISLKNAIARMKKNEYYALVTYEEGEILPEEYREINFDDNLGIKFATVSDKAYFINISVGGGIQRISHLDNDTLLLGPGPEVISLSGLVSDLHNSYVNSMNIEPEGQSRK